MNISIRKKKLKDGRESLFLDYYLPDAKQTRKKESLKLHIHSKPRSPKEREHNKKTLLLAESIKSKKLLELQHEKHGFSHLIKDNLDKSFITYFSEQTNKRFDSSGNYGNWDSTLKHLIKHSGDVLRFKDIDAAWLEDFKDYLQNRARTKGNQSLSQNSCYSYFNKVKACLKQAVRDKIIDYNPAIEVQGFKQGETEREFLTLEELKSVTKVKCEIPILKEAFIFSCLTGLRWSDINKLVWQEVQYSNEQGWYIRFRQKKTKGVETLPISEQAFSLLGEKDNPEERVFKGLKYSAWHNLKLQQWVMKAGISKTITFHCARHTYATLQLTLGTDIYTVSKLLGHRELKTTQVYAKIIDQKKVEAANIIPDLNL
ncbi:MAG: site-specific integrase [Flavobacteriales bacterium]|nr:site-specific integrase [Flavobacteriales bacterium]